MLSSLRSLPTPIWHLLENGGRKGKRSDRQHAAILELNSRGFSNEQIFWTIWAYPNGVGSKAHLQGEKWLRDRIADETKRPHKQNGMRHHQVERLDQVKEKELDWLCYPILLRGAATFADGPPGAGKSNFIKKICHCIADGLKMPNGVRLSPQPVIYYTAEEDASFIKKQLLLMGCKNLHNIYISATSLKIDSESDLQIIENDINNIRPGLVIFDIFMSYLSGKIDSHASNKVGEPMAALKSLAQKYNVSLALLRHTTKLENSIDAYKGQGSASLIGLARVGLLFRDDEIDPDKRIVTFSKANYTPTNMQLEFYLRKHVLENTSPPQTIAIPEWGEWKQRVKMHSKTKTLNHADGKKFMVDVQEALKRKEGIIPSSAIAGMARCYNVSEATSFRLCRSAGLVRAKIGKSFYMGFKDNVSEARRKHEKLKR